tara:strand:+ start:8464 stop:9156 length:693 start_codon:yes stop_codon:yes gene_type:complete
VNPDAAFADALREDLRSSGVFIPDAADERLCESLELMARFTATYGRSASANSPYGLPFGGHRASDITHRHMNTEPSWGAFAGFITATMPEGADHEFVRAVQNVHSATIAPCRGVLAIEVRYALGLAAGTVKDTGPIFDLERHDIFAPERKAYFERLTGEARWPEPGDGIDPDELDALRAAAHARLETLPIGATAGPFEIISNEHTGNQRLIAPRGTLHATEGLTALAKEN